MPRQLAAANRRPKRSRPIIDELPYIDIRTLGRRKLFPGDWHATNVLPNVSLAYPGLRSLSLTRTAITVTFNHGHSQTIAIRWYRPGLGGCRPIGQCGCKRTAFRLYRVYGALVCKRCTGGVYASQTRNSKGRRYVQAARIRTFVGGLPNVGGVFPAKPKNMRWGTYHRIRAQCLSLEANLPRNKQSKRIIGRLLQPRQRYRTWATAAVANSG